MRFRRSFFPLAAVLMLAGPLTAADQLPAPEPQAGVVTGDGLPLPSRSFFARSQSSELKAGKAEPFTRPDQSGRFQFRKQSMPLQSRDRNVCYTMRTYMVKPSERLLDDESGFRGYSSCQLASSYRVRSADAQEQEGAKLK